MNKNKSFYNSPVFIVSLQYFALHYVLRMRLHYFSMSFQTQPRFLGVICVRLPLWNFY